MRNKERVEGDCARNNGRDRGRDRIRHTVEGEQSVDTVQLGIG